MVNIELQDIRSPHWTQGGTGITNFSPDRVAIYQKALQLYSGPSQLVLSRFPMDSHNYGLMFSLHRLSGKGGLDDFWTIFNKVRDKLTADLPFPSPAGIPDNKSCLAGPSTRVENH